MKREKPYWEGWRYIVAFSLGGGFDGIQKTVKKEAIRIAKRIGKMHEGAEVYVYRTYITANGAHTQQSTIYENEAFASAFAE